MDGPPLRRDLQLGTLLGAVANAAVILAHSLRTRGPRHTALFAGLASTLPGLAEWRSINVGQELRHHTRPQLRGVPVPALCGWYTIVYASSTLAARLLRQAGITATARRWATPLGAALLATSLDLLLDPACLDLGLWEWRDGGPYAAEIAGPNGRCGIPLANYRSWLILASGVTLAYQRLTRHAAPPQAEASGHADRAVVGVLLAYYLPAAAWAIWRRQPRYLLYSALVPIVAAATFVADSAD